MTQLMSNDTTVFDTIREVVDLATTGRAFGEPISQDGVIVLPVARITGGGGGGGGTGPAPGEVAEAGIAGGSGGGLGLSAKPLGVYVIQGGKVTWRPAIDVGKVILGGQIVAIAALLTIRAFIKSRAGRT
ncbi:MAG: spore germination protein GerW family protein [Micromonosporaceae bacterium]